MMTLTIKITDHPEKRAVQLEYTEATAGVVTAREAKARNSILENFKTWLREVYAKEPDAGPMVIVETEKPWPADNKPT